ncbi:UNVERIFIED_CONTAM: hypothetical protein Slati_3583400 [Sesamum latifolium]|uniref:Uncharacterized protein n=1 Tax=Sesamum latifolium TaxID=2727402 RepID=A0AAW2TZF5_9LAMI
MKGRRRKAEERPPPPVSSLNLPRPSPPPPTATLWCNSGINSLHRQPPPPFLCCVRHSPVLTALRPRSLISLGDCHLVADTDEVETKLEIGSHQNIGLDLAKPFFFQILVLIEIFQRVCKL